METNIQTWTITGIDVNELKSYIPNYSNNACPLIMKESLSSLEEFVYQLALFNSDFIKNKEDISIEFYYSNNNEMTFEKKNPLITSITYLDDSQYPTIFTNTDFEKYKYKDFTNKNCFLVFPRILKHICFNGSNLYGPLHTKTLKSTVLVVNIYKKEASLKINIKQSLIFMKNNFKKVMTDDSILNYDFFEEIYYIKENDKLLENVFNSQDLFLKQLDNNDDVLCCVYEFPLHRNKFNEIINNIVNI